MADKRLTREDWTHAAMRAMAENGLTGVAVEPLAKKLGATKGSFYWHFANREDLITAALERWEREGTEAVIARLDPFLDGEQRLRQLVVALFSSNNPAPQDERPLVEGTGIAAVDTSIAMTADATRHPVVAEVVARVTARRVGYVADELVAAGVEPNQARQRALLAYAAYLGYWMLARSTPTAMPANAKATEEFTEQVLQVLMQRPSQPDSLG